MSAEEVVVHAGHGFLVEVDDNSAMIVVNPREILGQQLRPRQINLLNIIIILGTYLIIEYSFLTGNCPFQRQK